MPVAFAGARTGALRLGWGLRRVHMDAARPLVAMRALAAGCSPALAGGLGFGPSVASCRAALVLPQLLRRRLLGGVAAADAAGNVDRARWLARRQPLSTLAPLRAQEHKEPAKGEDHNTDTGSGDKAAAEKDHAAQKANSSSGGGGGGVGEDTSEKTAADILKELWARDGLDPTRLDVASKRSSSAPGEDGDEHPSAAESAAASKSAKSAKSAKSSASDGGQADDNSQTMKSWLSDMEKESGPPATPSQVSLLQRLKIWYQLRQAGSVLEFDEEEFLTGAVLAYQAVHDALAANTREGVEHIRPALGSALYTAMLDGVEQYKEVGIDFDLQLHDIQNVQIVDVFANGDPASRDVFLNVCAEFIVDSSVRYFKRDDPSKATVAESKHAVTKHVWRFEAKLFNMEDLRQGRFPEHGPPDWRLVEI